VGRNGFWRIHDLAKKVRTEIERLQPYKQRGMPPASNHFGCFTRSIETSIARQVVTFEEYGDPAHPVVKAAEARIEALAEKKCVARRRRAMTHEIRSMLESTYSGSRTKAP
jgi:hypothetical protein